MQTLTHLQPLKNGLIGSRPLKTLLVHLHKKDLILSASSLILSVPEYMKVLLIAQLMMKLSANEVFARHLLSTRCQQAGESLDEYLWILKALSKDCNFKSMTAVQHQEESIRDAFINGLQSSMIRQRLLENKTLDLTTMSDQAHALDSAQKNSELYCSQSTNSFAVTEMATARKSLKRQKGKCQEKIIDPPLLRKNSGSESEYSITEDEEENDEPDCCAPRSKELEKIPRTTTKRTAALSKKFPSENVKKLDTNIEESGDTRRLERRHNGASPMILLGVVFCAIFAVSFIYWNTSGEILVKDEKTLEHIYEEMEQELKYLHRNLHQTKKFWIQIGSQFKQITETSPLQPAVLLGIVPLDAGKAAACLSHHILNIVSSAFEDPKYIMFDSKSHRWNNASALKHDLDVTLQGLNEVHAAAVHNLEILDPEAMMIFHAYCDNDNAPHKRALILFTVAMDLHYSSFEEDKLDTTVYHHLTRLWTKKLRDVDASAIISRISNSPIIFKPEDSEVIQRLCPI